MSNKIINDETYCDNYSGLLRSFICNSADKECMLNYIHNSQVYECMLKNGRMTVNEYRTQYNPHYSINDKIYEKKIDCKSKEYFDDKERRLSNFRLYGRFEPYESYSKLTEYVK
jgi:hypothetical protein